MSAILTSWTVSLEEDPATGDMIIPIPQDLLDFKNWSVGDTLKWIDNQNGSWTLEKVEAK